MTCKNRRPYNLYCVGGALSLLWTDPPGAYVYYAACSFEMRPSV